jgi:hypothetical protein
LKKLEFRFPGIDFTVKVGYGFKCGTTNFERTMGMTYDYRTICKLQAAIFLFTLTERRPSW